MSKKAVSIILVILLIALVVYFIVKCKPIPAKSQKVENKKEQVVQSNQEQYQIVKHKYYTLAYSEENEQPAWVCYTLKKENVGGSEPRSNNFVPDPLVSTKTADDIDYTKSGYDKGHMLPAADMSWSPEAMKETFYFSNISPQVPSFNRGAWKKLEEKVRDWAVEFDSVKVYVGPVFKDNIKKIGPDSVTVPGYYFKTILMYKNSTYNGIGFIFPNKKITDAIKNYVVNIDSVEQFTGLDLYNYLSDNEESRVESGIEISHWFLSTPK